MKMSGQFCAPAALPPGTHWTEGLLGSRAGLDVAARKISCPYRKSNPGVPYIAYWSYWATSHEQESDPQKYWWNLVKLQAK